MTLTKAAIFAGAVALLYLVAFVAVALSATPTQTVTVQIGWTDNSDNEDGFRLYHCAGAGCTPSLVATLAANATQTSHTIIGDPGGRPSTYGLTAFNAAGDSAMVTGQLTSPVIVIIPGAPAGINLTVIGVTIP